MLKRTPLLALVLLLVTVAFAKPTLYKDPAGVWEATFPRPPKVAGSTVIAEDKTSLCSVHQSEYPGIEMYNTLKKAEKGSSRAVCKTVKVGQHEALEVVKTMKTGVFLRRLFYVKGVTYTVDTFYHGKKVTPTARAFVDSVKFK